MVSLLTKIKNILGNEPEEKKLVEAFVEVEKEFEEVKEEFEEIKEEVTQEEEPEVKEKVVREIITVRKVYPVEVGDILYNYMINDSGVPLLTNYDTKLEVTSVNEDNDTFIAEAVRRRDYPYLFDDIYVFSMEDMMRRPYGNYKYTAREKAFTYREKLTAENNFWRGKPKSGDVFHGKIYNNDKDVYGTNTTKYEVLGVTTEAFSAAPVYPSGLSQTDTKIFDIETLTEITEYEGLSPVKLFTTKDNAHTAYLHKEVLRRRAKA
ncbi:hypothetical protein MG295_00005 [Bacillus phage vB_BcgM]|nr:hypothetical protein MG295_00005 [Bacillus phage vB_BcgM]